MLAHRHRGNPRRRPNPGSATKLRDALGGYGTWSSAWTPPASGDLVDVYGSVLLTASGSPTYSNKGPVLGSRAVGFDSADDRFSAPNTSTFDLVGSGELGFVLDWSYASTSGTDYLFHKGVGSVLYQAYLNSSNFPTIAVWDGTTLLTASVSINHVDGNYHPHVIVFDRSAQRMRIHTDLGSSADIDISTVGSVSNAGTFRLGGTDPNRGKCAFLAVATSDTAGLRANGAAAVQNFKRYLRR